MNLIKRPAVLTGLFLLVLLSLIFLRTHGWRVPEGVSALFSRSRPGTANPEDAVYGMLDAARAGHACGLRLPSVVISPGTGPSHQEKCLTALALFR